MTYLQHLCKQVVLSPLLIATKLRAGQLLLPGIKELMPINNNCLINIYGTTDALSALQGKLSMHVIIWTYLYLYMYRIYRQAHRKQL